MADQARVERALRNAIDAGDMASARAIAQGWREQQGASVTHHNVQPGDVLPLPGTVPAERPGPSTGERVARFIGGTAGALAGTPAGIPGMIAGGAIGAPAAGEAYRWMEQQPELRGEFTPAEQANPFAAYGARIGRAILSDEVVPGSPPPRTTVEVLEDVAGAAIEGGLGGAAGGVGRATLGVADDALRSVGRGLRTRPGARIAAHEQRLAQQAAGAVDDRGAIATILAELGKTAGFGGAVGAIDGGLTAAGGAVVGAMLRLPAATRALLANNPRFARWALGEGPTAASTVAGAAAGQAAVQTGTFTADQVDQLFDMAVEEAPEVGSAIRRLLREVHMAAGERMR